MENWNVKMTTTKVNLKSNNLGASKAKINTYNTYASKGLNHYYLYDHSGKQIGGAIIGSVSDSLIIK